MSAHARRNRARRDILADLKHLPEYRSAELSYQAQLATATRLIAALLVIGGSAVVVAGVFADQAGPKVIGTVIALVGLLSVIADVRGFDRDSGRAHQRVSATVQEALDANDARAAARLGHEAL
ncbi:hypothetical protein HQ346_24840 [Rhodococcus sp. BP-252]|uniref:hypothetical protein n=1 Tax=unclassified Rhodococcus (in: high G+C Gram-positive bacteria) TaxID=192944 RepID=UPI001C9A68A3|nr:MULTISPECIES: hypothetical protein [unclassified Rhodococcus (in: high G+C Gram-positive bacteria)]MBY6414817.1 hypothetical protein [Rhodococcus sp. BP-320]MBY6419720.1 hypothetical protein [Rhodococcus sp. BP-321]MBY6424711.1 hypothetical protein [Rhodococcus sp. BP-324]MBY6429695.1 hypothetical protein [Rhodococcus sp. BP-323]MBY6434667.1 hypothetical protein [Rhodococcus sp. BP-322]